MTISIALFQPDIPGNTGTIIRLGACLGLTIHIIEPAGFALSDRNLKRAGMDYITLAHMRRHMDWEHFLAHVKENKKRLVLFTTKTTQSYLNVTFKDDDILLFGRESAGVPDYVHHSADEACTIPMRAEVRSLNLAMSVAMASGEAIRQTRP